ncbi:hypothetical protein GALMADRAFT_253476 [Galerina marginata CBS 339.88]|uniref:FAD-binding domain-containing protein n=1 Tax=Galerina marginata (strain CBS 339.88) TaxID=685588 RepID=A0A067SVK7_GALM3|nr:hypothetical protein GALMADRAFT_253476 [Galerina marginata CBS 339.88]
MPLRIGIVGGGIGGLTLAVGLSQIYLKTNLAELIEVDVYESAPELTQIGAGITFWPRAWKILEKLGLESELVPHLLLGQHVPDGKPRLGFQIRKADQQEGGVPIHDLVFPGAALSFHRAVVQGALLKKLSPLIRCHLSARLSSYHTEPYSAEIKLTFEDGKTATCDLLVGADGLKSVVRKQFLADNRHPGQSFSADPVWSGTFAYRCMIDSNLVAQRLPGHRALKTPTIYCGKNQHLVAYPILQGRIVNVAAYVSDMTKEGTPYEGPPFQDVTKEEVMPFFEKWEEEVRLLVEHMERPSRWAIHAIQPLDSYSSDSVILLGDAAHAMTPHQGNGAGQAIEDAYILAHLIAKAVQTNKPISELNKVYDAIRRPFANSVHAASRAHGLLYQFNASGFEDVAVGQQLGKERLEQLAELIVGDWEYAWMTTAEEDLVKGLAML